VRAQSPVPDPSATQGSLFDSGPPGLLTVDDFISVPEEHALLENIATLPFQPFAFHGWFGKRETISFGWRYDFNDARIHEAPPLPGFLLPLRERAAALAKLPPHSLEQALVVRYDVGAGIGWHKDRPVFDRVVGISLLAPCILRFRRREARGFRRFALPAPPRSAYLLGGEVRQDWEHSIAPMTARRFSITFRNRLGT
jgi:alkylated DNA repair dioxygenase AlkB